MFWRYYIKRWYAVALVIVLLFTSNPLLVAATTLNTKSPDIPVEYLDYVYEQINFDDEFINKTRTKFDVSASTYLYNLSNEPVAVIYHFNPIGYAIYDYNSEIVLEYSLDNNHPFIKANGLRYYFNGICNYYIRTADGYLNLATNRIIPFDNAASESHSFYNENYVQYASSVQRGAPYGPIILSNSTRLYNCNISSNLPYFYPNATPAELEDNPGVCGSVACAILVAYYDDYKSYLAGNEGYFADYGSKVSGTVSNYTYGIELVKEFIGYIEPDGNGSLFLNPGVRSYLSDHYLSGGLRSNVLNAYRDVVDAVGDDVPIIVGLVGHYCVAVGYKYDGTYEYIYVNTGWGGHAWYYAGSVLSSWTLYLD